MALIAADNDAKAKSDDKTVATEGPRSAFLGVLVEELHPAFASHLQGNGAKGQGLMVEAVGKDTPAAKAGIKNHDILMSYDDQKLFTPEQFIKLVSGDKTGREVSLGIIREGKPQTVKVQLGERTQGWHHGQHPVHEMERAGFWQNQPKQGQPGQTGNTQFGGSQSEQDNPWNTFDSLTLKKLDKDRFKASVAYTDKDGKLQKHEYEGTREEIHKKIDADNAVLPAERYHLLRGLDLPDGLMDDNFYDF
jgi:hypothetical protein